MKRISLVLFLFVSSLCERGLAQQFPQYSLFSADMSRYNPAHVGLNNLIEISAGGRYQWYGLPGAPISQSLNVQMPLLPFNSDAGLIVINNQQGLQRNTELSVQYNLRIVNGRTVVAIGARAGVIQSILNGNKIITPEGEYEGGTVNHNDPLLSHSLSGGLQPAFGAGIAISSAKMQAGISSLYLNEPMIDVLQGDGNSKIERNFFSYLTYTFKTNPSVSVVPSIMIKYDTHDFQQEANIAIRHSRLGWTGLGYRGIMAESRDALYAMLGMQLSKKISLAYAYDYTLLELKNVSNGSHELLVSYATPFTSVAKPGKIIYTPRF